MVLTNAHSHFQTDDIITIVQSDLNADFPSEGIHPVLDVKIIDEKLKIIESLADSGLLCAIGECGFDRESALSTEKQLEVLLVQVKIAQKHSLPLIIHCVGRWNELEKVIREYPQQIFILHGFRKMKLLQQFSLPNVYFSFGEAIIFDKNVWDHFPEIPHDHLLLETDDKQFDLSDSYAKVAELLHLSNSDAISLISNNFHRVFSVIGRKQS